MCAPHLVIHGSFRPPPRRAGGECDCLAVRLPAQPPARASALARTKSGSRGSGGRVSCQERSRRALGRWIRIRCTVSHLRPATHPGGRWRSAWPWWPGSWGNGTKVGRRGASLKGGCRVECRRGAIGHPKVLHQQVGAVRWVDLATASGRSTSRGLQVLHRARVARLPRQSDRRTAATGRRAPARAGKRVSAATTTTVPTITAAIQEVGRLALGAPPATRAATW